MKRFLSLLLCASMLTAVCLAGGVLPVAKVAAESGSVIFGGDFEAPTGDAVYNANWTGDVLTGANPCTIVEDTSGASEGNHCLKVPVTDAKYNKYLKGLTLQTNTSYTLSFDARGGQVWVFVGSYGVTGAPGVMWVGGTEEWKRYSVTITTGSDTSAMASFVEWGISISRDPAYATTVQAESYLDNFKLEVTPEAQSGIVTGGDFESPDNSTVYTSNWKTIFGQGGKSVLDPLNSRNRCLMLPKVDANTDFYLKNLYLENSTTYRFTLDVYSPSQALMFLWKTAFVEGSGGRVIPANTEWTTITFELTTAADVETNTATPDWIWGFARKTTEPYNDSPLYIDNVSIVKVEEEVPEEPEEPVKPDVSVEHEGNYVQGGSFEFPADDSIYKTNFAMMSSLSITQDPKNAYNHCLFIPQSPAKDYYFTNLKLEPLTTYVFEFDILSEGKAGVYFWGSSVFQNNTGSHSITGSPDWQHVKYEVKTTEGIRNDKAAYPNYLFAFMKSYEPYNQSDTYIDNVSITVKQKEVPSVKPIVTGGDFEDTGKLNSNWSTALNKGSVAEDTVIDGNHCLKLPKADSPIGDVYISNVWLEPNTSYFVTFDARGGASRVYFYGNALLESGSKLLAASDEWRSYAYRVTTVNDDTYLKGGYQNYIIAFTKKDAETNTADTFVDNVRVVKAGAYVDPELENGSITLSTWKDPSIVGAQASPAAGGTVTVTVTPNEGYMLKPGSLYYVTEDGTKQQILNKESGAFGEGAGNTFRFAMPKGSAIVTAEFVPTASQDFRFETLGASVYYQEGATDPNGLRFLNRLYLSGLNIESDKVTVTYDGKTYTVTEFGSLLKRASNTTTALKLENVSDTAPSASRVWKAVAYDGTTMKLVDYTDSYVDFTVIMKTATANTAFAAREYTACGYLVLSDGSSTVTLYSKGLTDSAENTAKRTGTLVDKDADWRLHPQDFKLIATTFDRPDFTDGQGKMEIIIEALVAQGGSATLNVAGESLAVGHAKRESQIALLTDAISKGFEIGSYTWGNDTWGYSKAELDARTEEELIKYISDTQAVVQEALGVTPQYLRPPLLLSNNTVLKVCKDLGISIVTGNFSWRDFPAGYTLEETGGATYESLTTHARDGAIWIIHAHNGNGPTEYARAIADLYDQGYRFCTVAELVEYNGMPRNPGQVYNEVIPAY